MDDFNPNKPRKLQSLINAAAWSRQKLQTARSNRVKFLKQLVGHHYSDNGSPDLVPVNFFELAISIYARQLSANTPKVKVYTRPSELKPKARKFEAGLNYVLEEIRYAESQRITVVDALIGMGIRKVGLVFPEMHEIDGFLHDAGQPFADPVHMDDWVHDMSARRFELAQYMGDRYTLPLDFVLDPSSPFDTRGKAMLGDAMTRDRNEDGDERGEGISRDESNNMTEFRERVEVWDYWIPHEQLVVTIPAYEDAKPLMVREWEGPEHGMYHILGFKDVPGNILPLSPAAVWYDIHDLANRLYRKLARQAARQKEITAARGHASKDGNRIVSANDGDMIMVDDPQSITKILSGGPNRENYAFFLGDKDLFSYFAGNIDALGGLSPQAETLGQDEMLTATASQRVQDMQDRTTKHSQAVIKDLGFYTWNDPIREMQLEHQLGSVSIPFVWLPEDRETDFVDFNIEIVPYSAEHQGPITKIRNLQRVLNEFYGPFMEDMKQQGIVIDFEQLNRIISVNLNLPEIEEVVRFTQQMLPPEQAIGSPSGHRRAPSFTKRTEERISRPGATRAGKDGTMARELMGIGQNAETKAVIGRPTG